MQSILAILFVIFLSIFLYHQRKKIEVQKLIYPILYFVMYKTKLGLKGMDALAQKFNRFWKGFAYFSIFIGFAGMALIVEEMFRTLYTVVTAPSTPAGVGVVQPFVPNVPGTIFVPFLYFIFSIIIIAVIHEGMHGVMARVYNIKIKSSGFAFLSLVLPIIPAAFVEPDEKQMNKRPLHQQLAIFSAGPVSNIITAFVVILFFGLVMQPVVLDVAHFEGIRVAGYPEGVDSPAKAAGIQIGELITSIDGHDLDQLTNFSSILTGYAPGDTVQVVTNVSTYTVTLTTHPDNETRGFMGISPKPQVGPNPAFVEKYGYYTAQFVLWFIGLLFWIYLLSLGIGLFNLLPLGPVDGGRMFYAAALEYLPKKTADKLFGWVSLIIFMMIIITIAAVIFL